jgi:hypothetical protein
MSAPPPPRSSSANSDIEEDVETSDNASPAAPEAEPAPQAPQRSFDPLADLLGITTSAESSASTTTNSGVQNGAGMQLQLYGAAGPAAFRHGGMEQSLEERVSNVKDMMSQEVPQRADRKGFGVDGVNMASATYGGPAAMRQQQAAMQQQPAYQQAMLQQQQMAVYNTMAHQSVAGSGYSPEQQQMMMWQQQQQQMMMWQQQQQQMMMMGRGSRAGSGMRSWSNGGGVAAMQAERAPVDATSFKVQRGTKPARVNAGDLAFGDIIDQMKASSTGKQ